LEKLDFEEVCQFVNSRIVGFHSKKLNSLCNIKLKTVLRRKNPYLFCVKNIPVVRDLISEILDAFLSSSEEKFFGDFLEDFARFVARKTCSGKKSAATGIDLEFFDKGIHYLVSVKSGPNWGNSSQVAKQKSDFETAVRVLKQSDRTLNIQPVLGICYGRAKTTYKKGYMKVEGQSFWHLISGNETLYTDIVEPLRFRAKEHNEAFVEQKRKIVDTFVKEFKDSFCTNEIIDWAKLVRFNSGNLVPNQTK
jgi:hypothetical protein